MYSLTHSLIYILTHSLTHSLIHSLTRSLIHSLTDSLTLSLTHSLTSSLTHSLTHSLIHTLTHLLISFLIVLLNTKASERNLEMATWKQWYDHISSEASELLGSVPQVCFTITHSPILIHILTHRVINGVRKG